MIALLYIPFCVFFAWLNAKWIAEKRSIKHGLNGLLHIVVACLVSFFDRWQSGVALLFITRVFFDVSLNFFRGLPFDYVSPNPKSIIDKWEKKLFGSEAIVPKIIYLTIAIIFMFV